ncbi:MULTISPECIES: sodium:solute symporter [Sphingobacterium]|uniref:Solute:sodium symporter (SSS) family transporter n=1 Tax=Sphingobacterium cellulitidis TaxID=1768011 RepID=A0A8H9KVX8_9SPHI|nr:MULTISPECIES: sodium:solute symporter [Sphingobacterium]MBA8987634.1 SSS family solute:Na+ symporter [Sphingobacterium soli]WFB64307.1 sodium:solute symporter [Sphingobacterium sp. WM]GGE21901.1 solute:sodium symporter (SSS) family transporter [Sphingobacterium soli]
MLGGIDLGISIFYILFILAVGIWAGMNKKGKSQVNTAAGYFLAGKSLRWPAIGLALFATNISTVHLVSLAQSGFDTGLLNGNFEWMAAFTLILLALFFVPFYLKSGVATLPDFLERRYDRASRDWLTWISIVSAIVIHIAFSMLAGGIVLKTLFGFNMYLSIGMICIITGLYTILGGLKAVVVTESIQTLVLLIGAFIITYAAFDKMGGWQTMREVLDMEGQMERLSMLRPSGDASGMPWQAVILGYPILGIWYWCADQTIVQRVLGAKDENHGRVGALFCGFLKILPVFIFVLPGLFAFTLFKSGHLDLTSLGMDAAGNVNSKGIYTLMITQLLPSGLIGVLVAALLSGLMSQISGALNSISTMVSYDIYKQKKPDATDKQLIRTGKISAVFAMILSLALLPLLDKYESIFNGINDVIAHIAPPITCVFLLGVFWKKASAVSSKWTLWIGSILGLLVFSVNKLMPESLIGHIPFMMMTFYLFIVCVIIQVTLSLIFPVQHTAESQQLYWKNPLDPLRGEAWKGIGNYRLLSGLLLGMVIFLYIVFR